MTESETLKTIRMPRDLATLAEWWCATNGYVAPREYPTLSESECHELYQELTRIPGVEQAGLQLWRGRFDRGLYPPTGEPAAKYLKALIGGEKEPPQP